MQVLPPNPEVGDPSQEEKMAQWGRGRAAKNPNGDCFYLAVGEANGDFEGFDNPTVANNLRQIVGDHMLANPEAYAAEMNSQQKTWRDGNGRGYQHLPPTEFAALWVKENVYREHSWAYLHLMSAATANALTFALLTRSNTSVWPS
jgi:hypothetical protein